MRRATILGMMGLILALAVILAALRDANDWWASGLYLATAVSIGWATVAASCRQGRPRAGRLGFAVFAGGYFALAFLGIPEIDSGRLPTTWLMAYIHRQVSPVQFQMGTFQVVASQLPPTGPFLSVVQGNPGGSPPTPAPPPTPPPNTTAFTTTTMAPSTIALNLPRPPFDEEESNRWRSLFPGAANPTAFATVGHCLLALLAGGIGRGIGLWSWSKAERERTPAA
ncbi:MAG: hypothetical protein U0800_20820 [Isosphaeraceae bacterium]